MKKILLILFLACAFMTSNAQSMFKYALIEEAYNNDEYSNVYLDSAITQKQKFDNARIWIAKTFGDYKSVLQLEDADMGKIIIKGNSDLENIVEFDKSQNKTEYSPILYFTLTIDCRNDKFRLKFENMSLNVRKKISVAFLEKKSSFDISASEFIKMGDDFKRKLSVVITTLLNSASKAIVINDDF